MMVTMDWPMSCMSPSTVPITKVPTGFSAAAASSGRMSASPVFIARAVMSISGMKMICSLKRSPWRLNPGNSPSSRMTRGSMSTSIACETRSWVYLWSPSSTASHRVCHSQPSGARPSQPSGI